MFTFSFVELAKIVQNVYTIQGYGNLLCPVIPSAHGK